MIPRFFYYLEQANRSWSLPNDDLQELKRKKLSRSMRWAYDYIPLYHSIFRQMGKRPEDFSRPELLSNFPMLTRPEYVRKGREEVSPKGMKPAVTYGTTGTTGTALMHEKTQLFEDVRQALSVRRILKMGVRPWSRIVTVWPPKVQWRLMFYGDGRRRISTGYLDLPLTSAFGRPLPTAKILVSTPDDLAGEARKLKDLDPEFIWCRPSHLRQVALQMERDGLDIHPSVAFLLGEPATSGTLKTLEKRFGTKVCRAYGSTEFATMGGDCRAQSGIHLYEDFNIFEVVRDGTVVGPGEMGELVVTSLHNDAMPLVRYRTGDLVRLADAGTCDCGSSLMRLESIQGRVQDGLKTTDGTRLPSLETANEMEDRTGFSDFQINQESMSRIEVRLAHGQTADARKEREIAEWLSALIGQEQSLTFAARDEEELWNKARLITSAVN